MNLKTCRHCDISFHRDDAAPIPHDRCRRCHEEIEARLPPTPNADRPISATTGARNAFEGMKATQFLSDAAAVQQERGQQYDCPEGERSGGRIAAAFNAVTGKDLTAAEVYLILQITKDVRQWTASEYHHDSALDCVSYAALKAEALSEGR